MMLATRSPSASDSPPPLGRGHVILNPLLLLLLLLLPPLLLLLLLPPPPLIGIRCVCVLAE